MKRLTALRSMTRWSKRARAAGKTIAFVPTMGALHEGHLSLVRRARREADLVVVSVFVNPLQFGPKEDFGRYPRDIGRDAARARAAGCHALFVPTTPSMYPAGFATSVSVHGYEDVLCGAFRPGHFPGVATVVLKLVNVVQPDILLLGQKDAQQAVIVKRLLKDLNLDVRVIVCPTVREKDGLAMSSRNAYLSPAERKVALAIPRSLSLARELVLAGEKRAAMVKSRIRRCLSEAGIRAIDYVEVVDGSRLRPLKQLSGDVLIAVAARVGNTRLIDNLKVRV